MDLELKASDLLADLFSGVADDDGELQAMLAAPRTGSGLSERLERVLSCVVSVAPTLIQQQHV